MHRNHKLCMCLLTTVGQTIVWLVADWLKCCHGHEVRWRGRGDQPIVYNGLPFIVLGRRRMDCLWGTQRCGARSKTATVSCLHIQLLRDMLFSDTLVLVENMCFKCVRSGDHDTVYILHATPIGRKCVAYFLWSMKDLSSWGLWFGILRSWTTELLKLVNSWNYGKKVQTDYCNN